MSQPKADELLKKYLQGTATPEEICIVESWYFKESGKRRLSDEENFEHLSEELWQGTLEKAGLNSSRTINRWFKLPKIAAVAMLIMVSAGYFYFNTYPTKIQGPAVKTVAKDIAPGGNKAVLTLADGTKVMLNDAEKGTLAEHGGIRITKAAGGQLIYTITASSSNAEAPGFNSIETPAGGQYQVMLPDGTRVWLNALSSLRYPTRFSGNRRSVELTGEAYFEVAQNKRYPFLVATADQEIEVLGTHFNINAYRDEGKTRTTLIEGSVKVLSGNRRDHALLKPGQQATNSADHPEIMVRNVDTELSTAWKDGYFMFNNENLGSVMKRISRWYDLEIEYEDPAMEHGIFYGTMSRYANVSELLKKLEIASDLTFRLEGTKVKNI